MRKILFSFLSVYAYFLHSLCGAAEPVFTRRPEAQKVGLNGVAEFHCGAIGNPAPTIFWTKEVVILTLSCSLEAEYDPEYLQRITLYLKILLRWHMLDFCNPILWSPEAFAG